MRGGGGGGLVKEVIRKTYLGGGGSRLIFLFIKGVWIILLGGVALSI